MRIAILLLLFGASCGEAAEPTSARGDLDGSARSDGFSGRATLLGELAAADAGMLMVSVYTPGSNMPLMTYGVGLDSPEVTRLENELRFDFRLDPTTSMIPGSVPEGLPLELEVRFDRDGKVETRQGDVTARVPAELGDDDLELILSRGS
jgi:hypothetical protein